MTLTVKSAAFENGSPIPRKFSKEGENVAPPLAWSGALAETRSFMVICEDPDAPAGTFRHWGIYGLAPERDRLPEGKATSLPAEQMGFAVNDFGNNHYDGPLPPPGHGKHHYHFIVVALDVPTLRLPGRPKVRDLWNLSKGHVLDKGETTGTYER